MQQAANRLDPHDARVALDLVDNRKQWFKSLQNGSSNSFYLDFVFIQSKDPFCCHLDCCTGVVTLKRMEIGMGA